MEPGIRVGTSGAGGGIAPQERSQSGDFKGAEMRSHPSINHRTLAARILLEDALQLSDVAQNLRALDGSRVLAFDDQIRQKLAELGITNLARRTVAKYRKLHNIPAARYRKKY